jgi:hypothetical protein
MAYVIVGNPYTTTQGAGGNVRTLTSFPLSPMAVWRTTRCRIFDANGNVTGYGFTTNPAWHFVEAILRYKIKPQQPALAGLTNAEKACFDWGSITATAARNDFLLPNGRPRFAGSYIFASDATLTNILETILRVSRSYQRVSNGQIQLIGDDPRASIFTMGANNYIPGTIKLAKKNVAKSGNVFVPRYRDVDVPAVSEVLTAQNLIASLTGPVPYTLFTLKTLSPFVGGDLLCYGGATDPSFNGVYHVVPPFTNVNGVTDQPNQVRCTGPAAGSANSLSQTTGGYVGTNNARFSERAPTNVVHRSHQKMVALQAPGLAAQPRVTPVEYDCGNITFDQANRLMKFERDSSLGPDTGASWTAPITGTISGWLEAIDVNGKALIDVQAHDIITLDDWVTSEFPGDYVVTDRTVTPPYDGNLGQIELSIKQYYPTAYTDISDSPGDAYATVPSTDMPFGTFPVFNAAWVLEETPSVTTNPGSQLLTVKIPDLSIQIMGQPTPTLYPTSSWSGLTPGAPYVLYVDDPAGNGVGATFGFQPGTLPLVNNPAGRYPVLARSFNANSLLATPVTITCTQGGQNYTGTGAPIGTSIISNSLIVNQIFNDLPIKGWEGNSLQAWNLSPAQALQQDNTGTYTGSILFPGNGNQTDTNFQGSFTVPAAGVYTLYFRVDDSWVLWLGNGATLVAAGINTANGSSASISGIASKSGLGAPLAGRMNRGLPVEPTDYVVVNFPTAGTYPFEMGWGNDSGNRYFMCTFAAGNLPSDESVNSVNWGSSILPVTP